MNKSPFQISQKILLLCSEISRRLGQIDHLVQNPSSIKLRKENRIKTIHSSLAIEGNTLSKDQVTALIEGKKVIGPIQQINEVKNALHVYAQMSHLKFKSENDFLKSHKLLMRGLAEPAGKYRTAQVGIFDGEKVQHMAPPAKQVVGLMQNLFKWLDQDQTTPLLVKACVFHYELEFIHPFLDGNGRMGRFWQQVILISESEVFEFLAIESLIHKNQKKYYKVLSESDKKGESTVFIEFSLEMILKELKSYTSLALFNKLKKPNRIFEFLSHRGSQKFTRKDYLQFNKGLSTATASRDLKEAVHKKIIEIFGEKSQAYYKKLKTTS